jgi:dihydroorotate dehydrogenase electron transfer subunit
MRPFAVHRKWSKGPERGQIELLFKVVGAGTAALAEKKPGDKVELLGPLGKGFDLAWCRKLSTAVVVAGGVGVAPLYPLVEYLRRHDVATLVIVGAMSEEEMPVETADSRVALSFMATRPELTITAEEFERLGCEVGIVTLAGAKGYIGLPTEMLDRFLRWSDGGSRGETGVFTCGPSAMMREVARHAAEHDLRCQVLLEERMGCGVGACMACTCRVSLHDGMVSRKRICVDGPVFNASEVMWDEE